MIQLINIFLSYREQVIFNNVSCAIESGEHIGVVGLNGAGKSTLLKILSHYIKLDSGTIFIEKNRKIAYLPQEVTFISDKSVFEEALSVFSYYIELIKTKEQLELLSLESKLDIESLGRYSDIQEELKNFNLPQVISKAKKILFGLGFNEQFQEKKVAELSVGWKMRLVLVKLLLQEADFYLFDEPTNHLDMVTKEWFYDFLKSTNAGFLLVTHDKYFLEKACDYIFEISSGNINKYMGNYSTYLNQKEKNNALLESTYNRQQREITQKKAVIERFRASATKAKMAQSMEKQLNKIEVVSLNSSMPKLNFKFKEPLQSGLLVLQFDNLSYGFNNKLLFQNISGTIQRGEKVGIVASNGTGKTTLFNIISGKIKSYTGAVNFGHNVNYTVFEQDQIDSLDSKKTIYEEVLNEITDETEANIRSCLGSFLFTGDTIRKKIEVLSGGERNRVALIKVLLKKANFLLLDEPTNHLDLQSKEILLKALQDYKGTVLIVSHDRDFLQRLTTRILELTPESLYSYPGDYESYLEFKKNIVTNKENGNNSEGKKQINSTISLNKNKATSREIFLVESKIKKLEKEIIDINKTFLSLEYGTAEYNKLLDKLNNKQKELDNSLSKWELLY